MNKSHHNKVLQLLGEDLVAAYLESSHCTILERNFYAKNGEIDILAQYKTYIFAVEVRTRSSQTSYKQDITAVFPQSKQAKVMWTLAQYLSKKRQYRKFVPGVLLYYVTKTNQAITIQRINA